MFRVQWSKRAIDDLTRAWLQATSEERQAITAASRQLDTVLRADPEHQGESRDYHERVVFEFPLGIRIEINDDEGTVWVLQAWSFRRRT
jgi:hypothetical protein